MSGVNNYKNVTTAERDDYNEYWTDLIERISYTDSEKVIISIFMPIVVTIGIIGNVMTIIVIGSKKCMHTPVNVYFANLAIADTLFLIVKPDMIWNSYLKSPVIQDLYDIGEVPNWVCPVYYFISNTGELVALLTIFWLSVERYMAICRPLKFQQSGFGICSRSINICGIIWFLGLSWNAQYLVALRTKTYEVHWPLFAVDILPNFLSICSSSRLEYLEILWYVHRALTVLMIVIIVVLYTTMLMSLRKSRITAASSTGTEPRSKSELKVFLTVFVTVTVYVVCLTPFFIYAALVEKDITNNYSPKYIFHLMTYINSSVNPVIYNAMNYKFRRAFCDVYCGRCNRKKNTPTIVLI